MSNEAAKQRAIAALQTLPDDATIEDAIERLCLIAKIDESLREADAGQLTDHEDVKKRFSREGTQACERTRVALMPRIRN